MEKCFRCDVKINKTKIEKERKKKHATISFRIKYSLLKSRNGEQNEVEEIHATLQKKQKQRIDARNCNKIIIKVQ